MPFLTPVSEKLQKKIKCFFRKFCSYNKLAHKHIYLNLFQASETILLCFVENFVEKVFSHVGKNLT